MEDIKSIVAKNITDLRLMNNMTQAEVGEKLSYSDKTISKWERGESSPDIAVLVKIAELYGVTVDYLVRAEHTEDTVKEQRQNEARYNRRAISYISESAIWLVAVIAFFDGDKPMVMYNPEILKAEGAYDTEEGCLSLLGGPRKCKRWQKIKVRWDNEQFQTRIKTFTGWTAQIIQHEIDHCNGVLI